MESYETTKREMKTGVTQYPTDETAEDRKAQLEDKVLFLGDDMTVEKMTLIVFDAINEDDLKIDLNRERIGVVSKEVIETICYNGNLSEADRNKRYHMKQYLSRFSVQLEGDDKDK